MLTTGVPLCTLPARAVTIYFLPVTAVRVSILSDDRLFCDGLVEIVKRADPSLVAAAYDEANRPDVLLLDSRMERALTFCADLKRESGPPLILVAAPGDEPWAARAIGAGARGILLRTASAAEVVKAIAAVLDGQIWAGRRVIAATIDLLTAGQAAHFGEAALEERLSAREREVFRHAARGLANKEVAGRLGMSEATVKAHLTSIFHKLGIHCRSELAAAFYGIAISATTT